MGEPTRKGGWPHDGRTATLGELIHEAVHRAIELAVEEELTAALGAARYGRDAVRGGYRNGRRPRTLTGPTGPRPSRCPARRCSPPSGTREWTSTLVPRYQRRLREVHAYLDQKELSFDTATERMVQGLLSHVDELERERASQRTYDAMRRKAEAGHVTGGTMFGYANVRVNGHVERQIHPPEAAVVRRIFELTASGESARRYAPELGRLGLNGTTVLFWTAPRQVRFWLRRIDRWVQYANSDVKGGRDDAKADQGQASR